MDTNKTITLLYEQSCKDDAKRILEWIIEERLAYIDSEKKETSGLCRISLIADCDIASDSAIIMVSDKAVENEDWQHNVRNLPGDVRPIPVGAFHNIDYNDPDIVPPCIEEINFIALDETSFNNLLDSLTTNPEFYSMKNHLLNRCNSWQMTNNKGDLLTNIKIIEEYKDIVSQKIGTERDPYLKEQLDSIELYLAASEQYAGKIRKDRIQRNIRRGLLVLAVASIVVIISLLKTAYQSVTDVNLIVSAGNSTGEPFVNALKLTEARMVSLSSEDARIVANNRFVELLDEPWEQNTIGINYKYLLNDCAIPCGSRYLWTAAENGCALLWDTYNGTIVYKEKLSDAELISITTDQAYDGKGEDADEIVSSQNAAAVDSEGNIYLKRIGSWTNVGRSKVDKISAAEIMLHGSRILMYDSARAALYKIDDNGLILLNEIGLDDQISEGEELLDADLMPDGHAVMAIMTADERLRVISLKDSEPPEAKEYDISLSQQSAADIKHDIIIVTDVNGQTYCIRKERAEKIPLILPMAISVKIIDGDTVVYHERNKGTGAYSIDHQFDYGPVLNWLTVASDIETTNELLVIRDTCIYHPIALKDILPVKEGDVNNTGTIWSATEAEDKLPDASIAHADVSDKGLIRMTLNTDGTRKDAVIDPACILFNQSGYKYTQAQKDLPKKYLDYTDVSFLDKSVPTVIGLRHVTPDEPNDKFFSYLLIGMNDGTFAEIGFDGINGNMYPTYKHVIPSRSAIISITETNDGYLLTDKEGMIWKCGSGAGVMTNNGTFRILKRKIHSGISKTLWDMLSPELTDALDLHIYPGGDGKEWE